MKKNTSTDLSPTSATLTCIFYLVAPCLTAVMLSISSYRNSGDKTPPQHFMNFTGSLLRVCQITLVLETFDSLRSWPGPVLFIAHTEFISQCTVMLIWAQSKCLIDQSDGWNYVLCNNTITQKHTKYFFAFDTLSFAFCFTF